MTRCRCNEFHHLDREKEKRLRFSPLARQTVRDAIQMFRGGHLSLMQLATVRASTSAGQCLLTRLAIMYERQRVRGDNADDMLHQLSDYMPGTEGYHIDALPAAT